MATPPSTGAPANDPANSPATSHAPPRVSPWVKAFVAFHVIACTIWALPKPAEAVVKGTAKPKGTDVLLDFNNRILKESALVYGYLLPTGFWQYWDMFAPNPAQIDFYGSATVEYLDGTRVDGGYPRVKNYGLLSKYIKERHRKFFERAHLEQNAYLWPYFAQRIAYLNASDPNNPPVRVVLVRNFQRVVRHDAKDKSEPPYEAYNYFTYAVDLNRLSADKGWTR